MFLRPAPPARRIGESGRKKALNAANLQCSGDVFFLFLFFFCIMGYSQPIHDPWRYAFVASGSSFTKASSIVAQSFVMRMINEGTYESVDRAYSVAFLVGIFRFYTVLFDCAIALYLMSPVVSIQVVAQDAGFLLLVHSVYCAVCLWFVDKILDPLDEFRLEVIREISVIVVPFRSGNFSLRPDVQPASILKSSIV